MTEKIRKTKNELAYNAYFREKCFLVLGPLCALLFVGYLYFLGSNLANVLSRSHILSQVHTMKNDNALLESRYLALMENLSLADASLYGLKETKEVYFAKETTFADASYALAHEIR